MPAPDNLGDHVQVYALENAETDLFKGLPDIDQMREIYKAALRLSQRPVRIANADAMDRILAEEAGLTPLMARMSLLVLCDMQLLALREKPFGLTVLPKRKTNPEDFPLWQSIQELRNNR